MTPEEEKELAELEELERLEAEEAKSAPPSPDAVKAAELSPIIDPSVSIPAQVLSTQPATSDPKGDEAAQADWMVKGTDHSQGDTIVYEPSLASAKKELLENPQLVSALGFDPVGDYTPEMIQQIGTDADIYKAYADHKWNDVRWAAAGSGTTAYRYSKAPWLQGKAAGMGQLETLDTKARAALMPLLQGATAFLMGHDDTANLGAIRRGQEATDGEKYRPPKPDDGKEYKWTAAGWVPADQKSKSLNIVGGAIAEGGGDVAKTNELLQQEYPGHTAIGQAAGLFSPEGVMGLLGRAGVRATTAAGAVAAKAGGGIVAQGAAKLGAAGAAAAAGGSAVNAGREGVEAASDLAKTGETDKTLSGVAERSLEAGLDPTNLGLGVGGEAAGMAAGALAKGIAGLPRYGGNVERVEQLGGKIALGRGPVGTEGAEAAIKEGVKRDVSPQDVIAEGIAPKINDMERALAAGESAVAKGSVGQAKLAKEQGNKSHGEFKQRFYATPEGRQALVPQQTLETNLRMLRQKVQKTPDGKLRPVGDGSGMGEARGQLSADVAEVSLKPQPGAIELSPEEAEMFLDPKLTTKLVPRKKPTPPGGGPPNPAGKPADAAWAAEDAMVARRGVNKQGANVVNATPGPRAAAPPAAPKGSPDLDAAIRGLTERRGGPVSLAEVSAATGISPADLPAALRGGRKEGKYVLSVAEGRHGDISAAERAASIKEGDRSFVYLSRKADSAAKEFTPPPPDVDVQQKVNSFGSEKITPEARKRAMDSLEKSWTPAQKEVANGHVMARFYEVNDALRTGKMTPEVKKTYDAMADAFESAIKSGGTLPGRTMRGISVTPDELKQLESAKTITAQGFVSQSDDPKIAKQFSEWGLDDKRSVPVLFEIDQVSGVPVGKGQGELVHRPGTQYRVVSSSVNADGTKVFRVKESGYSPGATTTGIIGGGLLAVGAAAASGDESGGAALASAGGLALALKKRGVQKVYAVPRRYDAQAHEARIGQLKDLSKNPQYPAQREAKELYAAALRDRAARPMGGQPGAWANAQKVFSERLTGLDEGIKGAEKHAGKKEAAVLRKNPEATHKQLVRYSKQRPGELPLKQEVEAAGERAGVSNELRDLRLLDPLQQLRGAQSPRKASPGGKTGIIGSAVDMAALRLIYPSLHSMGSDASHLRGGLLGTKALQTTKKKDEEEAR